MMSKAGPTVKRLVRVLELRMGTFIGATLALTMIPAFSFHFLPERIRSAGETWIVAEVGLAFVVGIGLCVWNIWKRHPCPRCGAHAARLKVPKGAVVWNLTCSSCGLDEPTGWQCGD